jgi:glycosyltransferase involved in cell wall biosynthesis
VKISVILPVFNSEQWIEETLDGVRNQGDEIEVIVVDDHSQDDSAVIARRILDRGGLTGRVLTTDKNGGPAKARNLGWQSTTAEWIQFLDADDLLAPGKLQVQRDAAMSAPKEVAVLYSPWQHFGLFNDHWSPYGPLVRSNVDEDTVSRILMDRQFGYVGPALIRRSALEAVGGFSSQMSLGEDLDLMLRIAMSGYKFRMVSSLEPLFFYRETPKSLWHRSAVDPAAVFQLLLSVRSAETYLESSGHNQISASTKLALASRYAERLSTLEFADPENFDTVMKWISDLHLRKTPPGASLPARLVAMTVGLDNGLRLQFALRRALGSRRRSRFE